MHSLDYLIDVSVKAMNEDDAAAMFMFRSTVDPGSVFLMATMIKMALEYLEHGEALGMSRQELVAFMRRKLAE